ncbi:MAG TPA: hypothetical protein VKX17_24575 [Planctomycetota bacterium]|nr:hypothetical protein [Planctomycetota bacterium]
MSSLSRFAAIVLSFAVTALAEESIAAGVKVVSDKNPDASSIEATLATIIKPGMSDQQKAEAIFDYLVRRTYHFIPPEEPLADALLGRKYAGENSKVMDATKSLNVYGHAICGSNSWTVNEFFNAAGLLGRIDGVSGHTVPEAKFDGKWHYLDVDMMGFVRRKDGSLPSVDEIKADKNLLFITHEQTPPIYFKYDGPKSMWGCLQSGVRSSFYGRKVSAHSMNLTLREGESMTRYFKRQWGPKYRYLYPTWKDSEYQLRFANEKEGPVRRETYYLFQEAGAARFGNWELIYAPPLQKKSSLAGIYQMSNVAHADAAPFLRAVKTGAPSEVVYSYFSPYGCAGCPNNRADPNDDSDGAVFEGEFATANGTVSYSLDLGRSWNEAHKGGGAFKLDLTPKLFCQYGWLIKLAFDGDGAGVKTYKSYISGQLSPATLPLVDGDTKMTFTRENTDCILFAPDITTGEAELKRVAQLENYDYFDESISGHVAFAKNTGAAIFRVDAPGEIVRVQTGAKFGCRKTTTLNGISFSLDEGKTWIVGCQQPVIGNEDHPEDFWGQCVDAILDVNQKKAYSIGCTPLKNAIRSTDFEAANGAGAPFYKGPSKSVLVKFHTSGGDGKLVQLYGIYVLYKKAGALPLTITHKWSGGEHVEKVKAYELTHAYEVKGGALGTNEWIKMEGGK